MAETPTYRARIWQEEAWWLAEIIGANATADSTLVGKTTQGRTRADAEGMTGDLIATWLDRPARTFLVSFVYEDDEAAPPPV